MLNDIMSKLYRLAIWYIGRCNSKWDKVGTIPDVEHLERLTFRDGGNKALLLYGADAEWQKFCRYYVLDNAIERLAQYEDNLA